jgi:lipoprotein-releasing system permease protein
MRYPALSIATRYLFSPKSTRVVNLISGITALAMAVGTAALIIVMSVFNGFESLIKSLYQVFYTDLVIVPAEGKFFSPDADLEELLRNTPGIVAYTSVLEENVLTEYNGRQYIATLKGVDDRYYDVVDELEDYMVDGSSKLEFEGAPLALLGAGVAYTLGISPSAPNNYLTLYMPRGDKTSISDVANAFRIESILPGGIFMVQQDFDSKFLITTLSFARQLMAEPDKISAVEIKLKNARQAEDIQTQLQQKLPDSLKVKTRYQQNETLYRVMRTEKWVVFAILSFIVLIAAFNVVGSLSMLVIEKRRDIATLKALGADKSQIRRIFLLEGMLMSLLGAGTGLLIGLMVCVVQIYFGVVTMPGSTFLVQYYPVELRLEDFLLVGVITFFISGLMAWLPAHRAVQGIEAAVPGRW